jgi:hypothetical protein
VVAGDSKPPTVDTDDDALLGLTARVGADITHSAHDQTALLTLINTGRRAFQGGVEISGLTDCVSFT